MQAANVLFVDNPVGTGYSYVTDDSAYTTNVSQIADDLMTLFSQFLEDIPVFKVSGEDRQQPTISFVLWLFLRENMPEYEANPPCNKIFSE